MNSRAILRQIGEPSASRYRLTRKNSAQKIFRFQLNVPHKEPPTVVDAGVSIFKLDFLGKHGFFPGITCILNSNFSLKTNGIPV